MHRYELFEQYLLSQTLTELPVLAPNIGRLPPSIICIDFRSRYANHPHRLHFTRSTPNSSPNRRRFSNTILSLSIKRLSLTPSSVQIGQAIETRLDSQGPQGHGLVMSCPTLPALTHPHLALALRHSVLFTLIFNSLMHHPPLITPHKLFCDISNRNFLARNAGLDCCPFSAKHAPFPRDTELIPSPRSFSHRSRNGPTATIISQPAFSRSLAQTTGMNDV